LKTKKKCVFLVILKIIQPIFNFFLLDNDIYSMFFIANNIYVSLIGLCLRCLCSWIPCSELIRPVSNLLVSSVHHPNRRCFLINPSIYDTPWLSTFMAHTVLHHQELTYYEHFYRSLEKVKRKSHHAIEQKGYLESWFSLENVEFVASDLITIHGVVV